MHGVDQQIDALPYLGKAQWPRAGARPPMPEPEPAYIDCGMAGCVVDDVFGFGHICAPNSPSGEREIEQVVHGLEQPCVVGER